MELAAQHLDGCGRRDRQRADGALPTARARRRGARAGRRWCSASPSDSSARRNRRRRSPQRRGLPFITLHGRRGGSAIAAAAFNALILGGDMTAVALGRRHRRGRPGGPLARRPHVGRHGRGADRRRAPPRDDARQRRSGAPTLAIAAGCDWPIASRRCAAAASACSPPATRCISASARPSPACVPAEEMTVLPARLRLRARRRAPRLAARTCRGDAEPARTAGGAARAACLAPARGCSSSRTTRSPPRRSRRGSRHRVSAKAA